MANDGGPMPMSRNPPGESPRGPVVLEGVGKEYGKFTALKALTLSVADGTSLGCLGPNGAGKSTTIKIITNLIRPPPPPPPAGGGGRPSSESTFSGSPRAPCSASAP